MNNKKTVYNITIGIGSQILSIALGIIIPRLFLTSFGSEMNGFLNSISQIFSYFALLESGVGVASLQALYGPVGRDDKKQVSEILAATSKYYDKTGIFYICFRFGNHISDNNRFPNLTLYYVHYNSNEWIAGCY